MAISAPVAIVHDLLPSVASATLSPVGRSSLRFPNNFHAHTNMPRVRSVCRLGQPATPVRCEPPEPTSACPPCSGTQHTSAPEHVSGWGCSSLLVPVVPVTTPALALAFDHHATSFLVENELATLILLALAFLVLGKHSFLIFILEDRLN